MRWITVAPTGSATVISLFPMGEQWAHYREAMGKPQAFTLHCDDIDATYDELGARACSSWASRRSKLGAVS